MSATVDAVEAKVRYINTEWRGKSELPRIGSNESRRAVTSFQEVSIRNGRHRLGIGDLSLDRSGFTLVNSDPPALDFHDRRQVKERYYLHVKSLVERASCSDRVFVGSHIVRTENPEGFYTAYARFVHCDYTLSRSAQMAAAVLERYGVEPQPDWRYVWYNTWQPFDHPVEQNPLALIDAETLSESDVIDYYFTGYERDELGAAPVYNPAHQFYYFPAMATDEVLLFKQLDERPGRASYSPHTSFDDPTAPATARPRRSIEVRLFAVIDD